MIDLKYNILKNVRQNDILVMEIGDEWHPPSQEEILEVAYQFDEYNKRRREDGRQDISFLITPYYYKTNMIKARKKK